jgi:hypothetical protein
MTLMSRAAAAMAQEKTAAAVIAQMRLDLRIGLVFGEGALELMSPSGVSKSAEVTGWLVPYLANQPK